jgi:hypothetical protein
MDAESILFLIAVIVLVVLVVWRFLIPVIQGFREGGKG